MKENVRTFGPEQIKDHPHIIHIIRNFLIPEMEID